MKIKTHTIAVLGLILLLCVGIIFIFNNDKNYEFSLKTSFSETRNIIYDLNDIEANSINEILERSKYVDDEYMGFSLGKKYKSEKNSIKGIDIQETVYGIALSMNTRYEFDSDKLQNYINENYITIEKSNDVIEKANYLYYNLMLDELNNSYKVSCSEELIQKSVNQILKEIDYGETIEVDINTTRKVIEIVMDMQIHNMEINITNRQRNKISNVIEKIDKEKMVSNSQFAIDVYLLTQYLEIDFDNISLFSEDVDNMVICYQIQICMEMNKPLKYLEAFKKFAQDMCVGDGIYAEYIVEEKKEYTLASILFGNAICKLSYGGEKDDLY